MTHFDAIRAMAKSLRTFDKWFAKAEAHAQAKKFDVDVLVSARLAPDQYALARQVQAACDQAKFTAAYLSGKPIPAHPDTEKTIAELRQRIRTCLEFVESVTEKELEGSAERKVAPKFLGGKWFRGEDYLVELAIPNYYFHATMVYAILRHNGVDLGKMDYLGSITVHDG